MEFIVGHHDHGSTNRKVTMKYTVKKDWTSDVVSKKKILSAEKLPRNTRSDC